jgi:putative FmdB family regulatory protein
MPLYDFQCGHCDEVFEIRASIKEKEAGLKPECPKCRSKKTRQVLTAGLVIHGHEGLAALQQCGPNAGPGCCGR